MVIFGKKKKKRKRRPQTALLTNCMIYCLVQTIFFLEKAAFHISKPQQQQIIQNKNQDVGSDILHQNYR